MQRPPGFTALELMVATTVLGVVLAVAIPTFARIRRSAEISTALHEITSSMASARLLAVTRNMPVSVCPSQDGLRCRRDRIWEEGWIVFLDPGRADNPGQARDIVNRHVPSARTVAVRSTSGRHWLRYYPSGMSPGSNQTLWLCSLDDGRQLGRVVVNNAGRVRSERDDDAIAPCPFQ